MLTEGSGDRRGVTRPSGARAQQHHPPARTQPKVGEQVLHMCVFVCVCGGGEVVEKGSGGCSCPAAPYARTQLKVGQHAPVR
eukprot:452221-Pelagomonas_calceolata.AAC.7